MGPATSLVLVILAVFLVAATVQGTRVAPKGENRGMATSAATFSYIIAAMLALAGAVGLVINRRASNPETGLPNTWTQVLTNTLGATAANQLISLSSYSIFVVTLIVFVVLTISLVSTTYPLAPLAWVAYVIVGLLGAGVLFLNPTLSQAGERTGRLGALLKLVQGLRKEPRVIGFLAIAGVIAALLALGVIYPVIGGAEVIVLAVGALYGLYQLGRWGVPKLWNAIDGLVDTAPAAEDAAGDAAEDTAPAAEDTTEDTTGDGDPDEKVTSWDVFRLARGPDIQLAGATAVVGGLIIAASVYFPEAWKHWPSIAAQTTLGKELLAGPIPLSTPSSVSVPGSALSTGTSNYTVSWWQFVNERGGGASKVLDLGPVGSLSYDASAKHALLRLGTALPMHDLYTVEVPVALQRWQQVVVRASGNRTDVFVDGQLVGSMRDKPPASVVGGDVFSLPGTSVSQTLGGIARLSYSGRAEPYLAIATSAKFGPAEIR